MPPLLHLLRHGQGYHSISPEGHAIRDPHLTPKGIEQCRERQASFPRQQQIDLLLASPLRRALQTCHHCFQPAIENRGLKIVAIPYAEEASADPCDTGSEVEVLRKEFSAEIVDFDHVKHGWTEHVGEFGISPQALAARAAKLRRWIREREEKEIVLVSHGFFNHYLTGDVDAEGKQTTGWWKEAEMRSFWFAEDDGEEARLKETEESLKARDGNVENVERLERDREQTGER